jgi:hypothetical protein
MIEQLTLDPNIEEYEKDIWREDHIEAGGVRKAVTAGSRRKRRRSREGPARRRKGM